MSVYMKITNESYRLALCANAETPKALTALVAAKNDHAAFQLIVQDDCMYSVSTLPVDWISNYGRVYDMHRRFRGDVKSPFPTQVQLEGFVTDDDEIKKADILLHQSTIESPAGQPSAVWVDVAVPADAKSGTYEIEVTLFSSGYNGDEHIVSKQTVSLAVADYTLQNMQDSSFYLDLWQHYANLARKHDVALWSEEHFTLIERYARTMAEIGQKAVTVVVSDEPWRGQGCLMNFRHGGNMFEYNMNRIFRKADGTYEYDFSIMQKVIDAAKRGGIGPYIEAYGLLNLWQDDVLMPEKHCESYPEAIRLRYFDEADDCMKLLCDYDAIKGYVKALETYFIETNQIRYVRIAADEPRDLEAFKKSLFALKEICPAFKYQGAIDHSTFISEFPDDVICGVPHLTCVQKEHDTLMQLKAQYPDKTILWYVCCFGGAPNTYIRSNPLEQRMIAPLTYWLGYDGFLRWAYTIWPDDPRKDIRYGTFEAGDTNFVYPAYNGDVLLSLRYKNLQRGLADYMLLSAVEKKTGRDAAKAMVEKLLLVKKPADFADEKDRLKSGKDLFTQDWDDMNQCKKDMLAILA